MGKKLDNEEVIKRFKEKGFDVVGEIINTQIPVKCVDENGYYYDLKCSNLNHNKSHSIAAITNPYTIQNIQRYLDLNSDGVKILSTEFIHSQKPLLFQCKCGKTFERDWLDLSSQKYKCCFECSQKQFRGWAKHSVNFVEDEFNKQGLKLLDKNYTHNNIRLLCEDEEGYRGYVPFNHLKRISKSSRNGFDRFSLKYNRENYLYNLNHFIEINNLDCSIVKILEEFKDTKKYKREKLLIKCKCGCTFKTNVNNFTFGKWACDECNNSISKGERKIKSWLQSNNINFTQQKRYDDCRDILTLPFDFYLNDFNILIEVDGKQHEHPVYFGGDDGLTQEEKDKIALENFITLKRHDNIKNEYCKINHIKLIRIKYDDVCSSKYKEILNKELFCNEM